MKNIFVFYSQTKQKKIYDQLTVVVACTVLFAVCVLVVVSATLKNTLSKTSYYSALIVPRLISNCTWISFKTWCFVYIFSVFFFWNNNVQPGSRLPTGRKRNSRWALTSFFFCLHLVYCAGSRYAFCWSRLKTQCAKPKPKRITHYRGHDSGNLF